MAGMATIKTSCPYCGDVDLHSNSVQMTICSYRPWSFYSFACPLCGQKIDKGADEQVIALLTSGGVRQVAWHVPAEAVEPKPAGPLTHDDLLDFHAALAALDGVAGELNP